MESPLSGVPAVFIKADDLITQAKNITVCRAIAERIGPDQLIGCQRIGKLWRIYTKTLISRIQLLTNSVQIDGQTVSIYGENPFRTGATDPDQEIIKVIIKDMPLSKENDGLKRYIEGKGLKLTRRIEFSKTRDEETHQLYDWLSGDRICYVEKFDPALPRVAYVSDTKIRIFHQGQDPPTDKLCTRCYSTDHFKSRCTNPISCPRCRKPEHAPDEICEATLTEPHANVRVIQGKEDILSNFYPCNISIFGIQAKSAEHAYQYSKAVRRDDIDVANKIKDAPNASTAKYQTRYLKPSATWKDEREEVMTQVLTEKAKQVPEFRDALIKTGEQTLVEAVRNEMYWASGLNKDDTLLTKKHFWMGKNRMGALLLSLRSKLQNEQTQIKPKKKSPKTQKKDREGRKAHTRPETRIAQASQSKDRRNRRTAASYMIDNEEHGESESDAGSSTG